MKWVYSIALACALISTASIAADSKLNLALSSTSPLKVDSPAHITAALTQADGKPVTLDMLKEVHTQKIHLLVIDPSLSDYHHLHPTPGDKPGDYVFDFTPKKSGAYRVWADVTRINGTHEYVRADIGTPLPQPAVIDKTISLQSSSSGYHFALTLDGEPIAHQAVMGKILVTRDGEPFTGLEPVMGAYAHIVGFGEDYESIMHIHPMGNEPSKPTDRGGPNLEFHLEPDHPGFVKLFVQIRVHDRDIFAPLGILVKAPYGVNAAPDTHAH